MRLEFLYNLSNTCYGQFLKSQSFLLYWFHNVILICILLMTDLENLLSVICPDFALAFIHLTGSLEEQELLILKPSLSFCFIMDHAFGVESQKFCLTKGFKCFVVRLIFRGVGGVLNTGPCAC